MSDLKGFADSCFLRALLTKQKVPRIESRSNLEKLKGMGIQDVMFCRRDGLPVHEVVAETWVYKRLRNVRAGIEGCISFLKRRFGWDRCLWRGLESPKAYV